MNIIEIIEKKRNGLKLSAEEIYFFVNGVVSGKVADYQASALLMAICINGMDKEETSCLTLAMRDSGNKVDLSSVAGIKVDKHSTGGVADDTTLLVAPLVAACGGKVAKISGRGLGFTGGTLDKLESIPGFQVELSEQRFKDIVSKIGLSVIGQSGDIDPADKKLYALRDVTATVQSIPLIAASVMSKKLALGCDGIVLDVKTGNGAFMTTLKDSIRLASAMVEIGNEAGARTVALVTDMNQPLGNNVGNALAVRECLKIMQNNIECDLKSVSLALAARTLMISDICDNYSQAMEMLEEKLSSGQALVKFAQMVEMQGGNPDVVDNPDLLPEAGNIISVKSDYTGYIANIDTQSIGLASCILGCGRKKKDDVIDPAVGIILRKRLGDYVKVGEELAEFHVNNTAVFDEAVTKFKKAYTFSSVQPDELPLIYTIIDE